MKRNVKRFISGALAFVLCLCFCCGCEADNSDKEKASNEATMQRASDVVGQPNVTKFFEKKMAKKIFELRDDSKLICYAYSYNEMTGKYTYIGRCIGYGLPYSTQYTQPEYREYKYGDSVTLPQADPNGLYTAEGMDATWLCMIDDNTGKTYIWYCEPTVIVSQNKIPKRLVEPFSIKGIDY